MSYGQWAKRSGMTSGDNVSRERGQQSPPPDFLISVSQFEGTQVILTLQCSGRVPSTLQSEAGAQAPGQR